MKWTILFIGFFVAGNTLAQDPGEALNGSADAALAMGSDRGVANVIWDEDVDGDLGDRLAPTSITLASPNDLFRGTVGGPFGIGDFDDCVILELEGAESISQIVLESYVVTGGNLGSGFNLFTGAPAAADALGDILSIVADETVLGLDLLGMAGPLDAGTYTICMLEGTPGQQYALRIVSNVEPEVPESQPVPVMGSHALIAMILLLMIAGAIAIRRL